MISYLFWLPKDPYKISKLLCVNGATIVAIKLSIKTLVLMPISIVCNTKFKWLNTFFT